MMIEHTDRCAYCETPIVDPTTRVIHGRRSYCCANCSTAMEQHGSGSDPDVTRREDELRCAHCSVPIVDAASMETDGEDRVFCCPNCRQAMTSGAGAPRTAATTS